MTPRIQTPVFSLPDNHRHPCSGPVFKNQLTGTKVFFPGLRVFTDFLPEWDKSCTSQWLSVYALFI